MSSPLVASTPRLRPAAMPTVSGTRTTRTASPPVTGQNDLDVDVLLRHRAVDGLLELDGTVAHREDDHGELHLSLREATMLTKCRPVCSTATTATATASTLVAVMPCVTWSTMAA